MKNLVSRRHLLAAAGTSTLLGAFAGATQALPSYREHQSLRALHRLRVGRMRVTVIDDARMTLPAAMFGADQPDGAVGSLLQSYGLPADMASLHMQVTLVESGPHKVLLDTGMGDFSLPDNPQDNGRLLAGLAAVGVSADDISAVIISHGHPDHIGGCSSNGEPVFKNAHYYISPDEREFWTQKPGDEQNFMNMMLAVGLAQLEPVRDLIRPYHDEDEVIKGVSVVAARGHTLGHHAVLLHDGESRLLHLMDTAVHHLIGLERPDWQVSVEMKHGEAVDTRRRLLKRAADEKLLVAGYHFPFPGIGRIVEFGSGWRFVPMHTA